MKKSEKIIRDEIFKIQSLPDCGASWSTHRHSDSTVGRPHECPQEDINEFISRKTKKLPIGYFEWTKYSHCEGDELLDATVEWIGRNKVKVTYYAEYIDTEPTTKIFKA